MPIYEYQCGSCGHQLEAFQKISEPPLTECPACNQAALTKLISATSFQLKGTGWYATDIRDKGKPKPAASGEASTASTDSSKPEASSTDTSSKKSNDSSTE